VYWGTVYSSKLYNGKLYIGTNQGLFYKKLSSNEFLNLFQVQRAGLVLFEYDGTLFFGHDLGTST
jgi:ligand-binding sensor domain-containing protein